MKTKKLLSVVVAVAMLVTVFAAAPAMAKSKSKSGPRFVKSVAYYNVDSDTNKWKLRSNTKYFYNKQNDPQKVVQLSYYGESKSETTNKFKYKKKKKRMLMKAFNDVNRYFQLTKYNAKGKATKVNSWDREKDSKTYRTFAYDKAGFVKKFAVKINGKTAKLYANHSTKGMDRIVVQVMTLKNKKPFMWIDILDAGGKAHQGMYRYKNGFLRKQISNDMLKKKNTSNPYISEIEMRKNRFIVQYDFVTTVTGITRAKYSFVYAGGDLVRTGVTTAHMSYATGWWGIVDNNPVTAAGKFKVYTKPSLKKVKFTVNVGKKVIPRGIRIQGNRLLYKIKVGKKSGWIACPKIRRQGGSADAPTTLFFETYGVVPLRNTPPSYTDNKYYTPKQLQRYTNHALYIARNEIYARNGYIFKNAELRQRFMKSPWWRGGTVPLNDYERENARLILSIEQNRESLYV